MQHCTTCSAQHPATSCLGMSLCFPPPKGPTYSSSMDVTSFTQLNTNVTRNKETCFRLRPSAGLGHSSSNAEADGSPSSILKDRMCRFMNFSAFDTGERPMLLAIPKQSESEGEMSTVSTKQLRFR